MTENKMKVYALGPFYLESAAKKMKVEDWKSQKALKLFRYLLVNYGKTINSERIIAQLWPNCGYETGKSRLYDTVYRLRQVIDNSDGESYILKTPEGYMLNKNKDYWFDWKEFDRVWSQYEEETTNKSISKIRSEIKKLKSAVELYRGEFMENSLADWLTEYRSYYQQLLLKIIKALSVLLNEVDQTEEALDYLRYGRQQDPLQKDFYLLAMKMLKKENKISKVYSLYQKYEQVLEQELGIVPSQDLETIYEQLDNNTGNVQEVISDSKPKKQVTKDLLGAMICQPQVFNKIYELRRRDMVRTNITCTLLKIKFSSVECEESLQQFIAEISNKLRTVDVICREQNIIYVLLYDALVRNSNKISSRLFESELLSEVGTNPRLEWKELSVSEK